MPRSLTAVSQVKQWNDHAAIHYETPFHQSTPLLLMYSQHSRLITELVHVFYAQKLYSDAMNPLNAKPIALGLRNALVHAHKRGARLKGGDYREDRLGVVLHQFEAKSWPEEPVGACMKLWKLITRLDQRSLDSDACVLGPLSFCGMIATLESRRQAESPRSRQDSVLPPGVRLSFDQVREGLEISLNSAHEWSVEDLGNATCTLLLAAQLSFSDGVLPWTSMLASTLRRILVRYRRTRTSTAGDTTLGKLIQMTQHTSIYDCKGVVEKLCSQHTTQSAVSDSTILSLLRPFSATELKDDSPWRVLCDITTPGNGLKELIRVGHVLAVQLIALERRSANLDVVQTMKQQLLGGDHTIDILMKSHDHYALRFAQHGTELFPDWWTRCALRLREIPASSNLQFSRYDTPAGFADDVEKDGPCVSCQCHTLEFLVDAPVVVAPPKKPEQVSDDDLEWVADPKAAAPAEGNADLSHLPQTWATQLARALGRPRPSEETNV
ncbi:hypothetical protein B0H19DRAFT_1180754 [Mycena capillaripes]|nr:hypothetical protein B0H19DRAFT_1180754 [Mycena capillaripes]